MPEGDTIHRTAATLRRVLEQAVLDGFEAPRLPPPLPLAGTVVERVEARGKHLLLHLSGGRVLHTHLGMTGSWHVYRPDSRWQKPERQARVVLRTAGAVVVCFNAPVVELLDERGLGRHPVVGRLGPDLCLPDPDLDRVVDGARRLLDGATAVGDVLLDQRVASGIGNVYRCEVCYLQRVHPARPTSTLDDDRLHALFATAADLLRRNLEGHAARTTVPGSPPGTLYVYGRAGQPCRGCGAPVAVGKLGGNHRVTYWCPSEQPTEGSLTPGGPPT